MNIFKALANVVALPVVVAVDIVTIPFSVETGEVAPLTKKVLKNLGES